jgi:hypothetical protein
MSVPFGYHDLIETFPQPGCAVCRLLERDVTRHLESSLYEFVIDPPFVHGFRDSRGLCNEHAHQLIEARGHALGVSILYDHVLDEVLSALDKPTTVSAQGLTRLFNRDRPGVALANALEPSAPCIACELRDRSEVAYLDAIAQAIGDPRLRDACAASDGLCLPHFRQLLRAAPTADAVRALVTIQDEIWRRLKAELEAFARKSDFHNAAEAMGSEADSWKRAADRMSGQRGVFGLRSRSS